MLTSFILTDADQSIIEILAYHLAAVPCFLTLGATIVLNHHLTLNRAHDSFVGGVRGPDQNASVDAFNECRLDVSHFLTQGVDKAC